MLTLFALPKPFKKHVGIIQKNAVTTWLQLQPKCQVILFGDEEGIEEAAYELGAEWYPEVKRNRFGTPLLSDAFRQAVARARHDFVAYVNSDIMLMDDFPRAMQHLPFDRFLATGRRCNLEYPDPLDIDSPDWVSNLRRRAMETGELDSNRALDYFIFDKKSPLAELPEFAVGRPGWDNWMIYNARRRKLPVVDLTQNVMALHQLHDYNHVPQQRGPTWQGPEADLNADAAGSLHSLRFCLYEATHKTLCDGSIAVNPQSLGNRIRQNMAFWPSLRWPLEILAFPVLFYDRQQRRRRKKKDLLHRTIPADLARNPPDR